MNTIAKWGTVPAYHCAKCKWHGRIDSRVIERTCLQCGKDGLKTGFPGRKQAR